jgi:hypothetical protein
MKHKLTKSRFKLALECPVKLYYTGKPEYPDIKTDDPFLDALAEGGFQIGELAKLYFPEGHRIYAADNSTAIEETSELLKQDNITIFEAAVSYKNFFIRIDILEKHGNRINLIEVKAKSIDLKSHNGFVNTNGSLLSKWSPYLYDTAFQKYVLSKAFPEYTVSAFLMLADKNAKASVDGLHQRFFLKKDRKGKTSVIVKSIGDTGNRLLTQIRVDNETKLIYNIIYKIEGKKLSFNEYADALAEAYVSNRKIKHPIGRQCQSCEFDIPESELAEGKFSGFRECWKEKTALKDKDFKEQMIFELWNYTNKQNLIDKGIYFIKDINESSLPEYKRKKSGLTINERQLIQIQKVKKKDNNLYIDKKGMSAELNRLQFPLHFIDFETTMTAIPFNKGRRPYEIIAFQFSHHIVHGNGRIEHKGQYLNTEQGYFPNYDFIRALKKELADDNGSIFRYADHENTVLTLIHRQMHEDKKIIANRKELASFIEAISHSNGNSIEKWRGERDMIDLLDIVKRYYYHPVMKGSNSIKAVLPAVMESAYIQKKYSGPVYGGNGSIKSLNFKDQVWLQKDARGQIINPYKLLPPLFKNTVRNDLDSFLTDESLADGGAAMTAYARMQFTEMTGTERKKIAEGLLRYCELDTLAMVMIYEYFRSL